jgi:periplasmic divalent cation tolerance protein
VKPKFAVVLVTAPNLKLARALARAALAARLVACVNLVPSIESHYWSAEKLESGREILLVLKTTTDHLPALEKLILQMHPYDTAEFLALPIARGAQRYLDWMTASVRSKVNSCPPRLRPAKCRST